MKWMPVEYFHSASSTQTPAQHKERKRRRQEKSLHMNISSLVHGPLLLKIQFFFFIVVVCLFFFFSLIFIYLSYYFLTRFYNTSWDLAWCLQLLLPALSSLCPLCLIGPMTLGTRNSDYVEQNPLLAMNSEGQHRLLTYIAVYSDSFKGATHVP